MSPVSAEEAEFGARAYHDGIADFDEQVGMLLDKLRRGGVFDHIWLIITADRGGKFGEYESIVCLGTSLYQTEVDVRLLFVPPCGKRTKQIVTDAGSLLDLAATIVGVTDQTGDSPFAGDSLARFRSETPVASNRKGTSKSGLARAEVVPNPNVPGKRDSSDPLEPNFPLRALEDADWTYGCREEEPDEELFHQGTDAKEDHNHASDSAARTTLERLRAALGRITGGPLLPGRLRP
jgi:arylsulfatase A-like enzyme